MPSLAKQLLLFYGKEWMMQKEDTSLRPARQHSNGSMAWILTLLNHRTLSAPC